jgi:hypothetical protein
MHSSDTFGGLAQILPRNLQRVFEMDTSKSVRDRQIAVIEEKRKWAVRLFTQTGKPDIKAEETIARARRRHQNYLQHRNNELLLEDDASGRVPLLRDVMGPGHGNVLALAQLHTSDGELLLIGSEAADAVLEKANEHQKQATASLEQQMQEFMAVYDQKYGNRLGGARRIQDNMHYFQDMATREGYTPALPVPQLPETAAGASNTGHTGEERPNLQAAVNIVAGVGGTVRQLLKNVVNFDDTRVREQDNLFQDLPDVSDLRPLSATGVRGIGGSALETKKRNIRNKRTLADLAAAGRRPKRANERSSTANFVLDARQQHNAGVQKANENLLRLLGEDDGDGFVDDQEETGQHMQTASSFAASLVAEAALEEQQMSAQLAHSRSPKSSLAVSAHGQALPVAYGNRIQNAVQSRPQTHVEIANAFNTFEGNSSTHRGQQQLVAANAQSHQQMATFDSYSQQQLPANAPSDTHYDPKRRVGFESSVVLAEEEAEDFATARRINRLTTLASTVSSQAETLQYAGILKPLMEGMSRMTAHLTASDAVYEELHQHEKEVADRSKGVLKRVDIQRKAETNRHMHEWANDGIYDDDDGGTGVHDTSFDTSHNGTAGSPGKDSLRPSTRSTLFADATYPELMQNYPAASRSHGFEAGLGVRTTRLRPGSATNSTLSRPGSAASSTRRGPAVRPRPTVANAITSGTTLPRKPTRDPLPGMIPSNHKIFYAQMQRREQHKAETAAAAAAAAEQAQRAQLLSATYGATSRSNTANNTVRPERSSSFLPSMPQKSSQTTRGGTGSKKKLVVGYDLSSTGQGDVPFEPTLLPITSPMESPTVGIWNSDTAWDFPMPQPTQEAKDTAPAFHAFSATGTARRTASDMFTTAGPTLSPISSPSGRRPAIPWDLLEQMEEERTHLETRKPPMSAYRM